MPGSFPVDEESSDLTFVFWYSLQVYKTIYLFFANNFIEIRTLFWV